MASSFPPEGHSPSTAEVAVGEVSLLPVPLQLPVPAPATGGRVEWPQCPGSPQLVGPGLPILGRGDAHTAQCNRGCTSGMALWGREHWQYGGGYAVCAPHSCNLHNVQPLAALKLKSPITDDQGLNELSQLLKLNVV